MKNKIFLGMTLLLLLSVGVTTYLLFFNEKEYVATKTVEEINAKVNYTEAIVKEFKEIKEMYFYQGEIAFDAQMKSKKTSKLINWLVYKETSVKVVGDLKAGVDLTDLTIKESENEIEIDLDKEQIIKLFIANKKESKIHSESGMLSLDYDAEEMTTFWAEIEQRGTEQELPNEQMEEVMNEITEGIKDLVKTISKSEKKITVQLN